MEAKTTELIGVAITVLTFCGGIFTWVFGKVLKQNSDSVTLAHDLSQAKKEIEETKVDVKDIREDIMDLKIKIK